MVKINAQREDISIPSEHGFLDRAYVHVQSGEVNQAKEMLLAGLTRIRRHLNDREWALYLSRVCIRHPVHELFHFEANSIPALESSGEARRFTKGHKDTVPRLSSYYSCVLCRIAADIA